MLIYDSKAQWHEYWGNNHKVRGTNPGGSLGRLCTHHSKKKDSQKNIALLGFASNLSFVPLPTSLFSPIFVMSSKISGK